METNLPQINKVNIPNVEKSVLEVYNAHSGKKISRYEDKNDLVRNIHSEINIILLERGLSLETEEINFLKIRVTEDIFKSFGHFTLQDIKLCFKNGVRGLYGKYYGVNTVSIFEWLTYYNTNILPNCMLKISQNKKIEEIVEVEKSKKEIHLILYKLFIDVYNDFKSQRISYYDDFGNILYKFLVELEIFELDDKKIKQIEEITKKQVIENMKSNNEKLLCENKIYQLINLDRELIKINGGESAEYKIKLHRNFLIEFIKTTINKNVNIVGLIKDKLNNFKYYA